MNLPRLSSWFLLGGIIAGFGLASWLGHDAAGYSKPDGFQRFHQRISPDTIFYPPYAMLERLALARWQPGRTLVIVGGNSIFNGVGQTENELWTARLQSLLGDRYVVVNLAFRAAPATQGAALVAESLLRRGYPVLYVANSNPVASTGRAAGGFTGYLYWQARAQGRLEDWAPRDADLARWLASLPPAERRAQEEARLDAELEVLTRHQSLWHHVGYRHFFTVWNFAVADTPWSPRYRLYDNEAYPPPVEERFRDHLDLELRIVRSFSESLATRGPDGRWQFEPGNRQRLATDIATHLVPALRPRTLMVLTESAPYYLARLTPEERERDAFVHQACAEIWRSQGVACTVVGPDFTDDDYLDRVHLTSEGGNKLAATVAQEIRQLTPIP